MAQDLTQMAKAEYDNLTKLLAEKEKEIVDIKAKLHPLAVYLKEVGVINKETRKRD